MLPETWKAAFSAGRSFRVEGTYEKKQITKAQLHRFASRPRKYYRKTLPPPPKNHWDIRTHELGAQFKQAELDHLQSHKEMGSWQEGDRSLAIGKQVLDCMWVYAYKFNKHGALQKCKARLVVRGDQEKRSLHEDTYAATLAGKSFRVLMAIATRFDLELLQYDAVNAFVNADLNEEKFMELPPGYRKPGKLLSLKKALYGLRKSPVLWQRELSRTLESLGFAPVKHEPCCFSHNGIFVFFYVDDIVIAFRKSKEEAVQRFVEQLKARYKLTGGHELQWFLGMEIIRDRQRRRLWLSQASYIDKIALLAESTPPHTTPMGGEELLPRPGGGQRQRFNTESINTREKSDHPLCSHYYQTRHRLCSFKALSILDESQRKPPTSSRPSAPLPQAYSRSRPRVRWGR